MSNARHKLLEERGMPCHETVATHYNALIGLQDEGRKLMGWFFEGRYGYH